MKQNPVSRIIIFLGTFFICCSCYASGTHRKVETKTSADSEVLKFLGSERLAIISTPDKIEAYQVDWQKKPPGNHATIQGYPVIAQAGDLNAEHTEILKTIIFTSKSYEFQRAKRTRLRPSYILRFIQNTDKVDVAIDFDSRQWGFFFKGNVAEEDISEKTALTPLTKLVDSLFKKK
ncbi:MAG: hypothetical protein GY749_30235 [Desulfobacteraceae bacterium]|nr:hypothetical protein [Desulfobacteraceae bacterium]